MLQAGNFEHGVVASRPDQMYGWPGITRVQGEEVLASASERKYHADPVGREVVIRSYDGGKTWGLPCEVYNSELDDRDANLLTMADGTIILTWFTSTAFLERLNDGWYPQPWQEQWAARAARQDLKESTPRTAWLMRSTDGGRTWGVPHETPVGQHAGPSVLSDGRLVYIGATSYYEGPTSVWESSDKGETWRQIGEVSAPTVGVPPRRVITENHVLELSPGHLLAIFRTGKFPNSAEWLLYQSNSEDGGHTWSEVGPLPIWGHPPHLIRLSSGAILCSYGHRRDPWSIRAVLSYDEGQTWSEEDIITLYTFDGPCDMGYPVSLEVTPGQILTVYYCNLKEGTDQPVPACLENPGGILYTRWTVE